MTGIFFFYYVLNMFWVVNTVIRAQLISEGNNVDKNIAWLIAGLIFFFITLFCMVKSVAIL